MENLIQVPFGSETLEFEIPESWNIMGICEPQPFPYCENIESELRRSLKSPFGAEPLVEFLKGVKSLAVIVDDLSRPTPVSQFFSLVMNRVEAVGISSEDIDIVFALGVHRKMTKEEMIDKIGREGYDRYRCHNHDCNTTEKLAHLGYTSRGTPVLLNKTIARADAVIALGCIEPHTIAGFGGGYKNFFPGVAGKKTIAANHALNTTPSTYNMVGSNPKKNPMRLDLEECGEMVPGKTFIVNTVLDGILRIARIVSGDPIEAHRAGIETSKKIFGVKIPKPADVLITCSHPMNNDLRQGFKALANTIAAVRKGGVMINLIRADEGLGDMSLPKRKIGLSKKAVRVFCHILPPLVGKLKFGLREEDLYFVYFGMQMLKKVDVYFYCPNLPQEFSSKLPFLDMHKSLDEVLKRAHTSMPGPADVLVFPKGGVTYPILG